jgi:hypothetical protein
MIEFETGDRGFKHYAPIDTTYGHRIKVSESSSADAAHLWLAVDPTNAVMYRKGTETRAHLTVEQAETLIETLRAAIDGHYQFDGVR